MSHIMYSTVICFYILLYCTLQCIVWNRWLQTVTFSISQKIMINPWWNNNSNLWFPFKSLIINCLYSYCFWKLSQQCYTGMKLFSVFTKISFFPMVFVCFWDWCKNEKKSWPYLRHWEIERIVPLFTEKWV